MTEALLLNLLADTILVVHFLFVCFVVLGLGLIYLGYFWQWAWVRNRRLRIAHLAVIGVVVLQSWLGMICPLTTWEMALREAAGQTVYTGAFVQHWLHQLLFFNAPAWVFIVVYTLFGILVAASWFVVRPHQQ